MREKKLHFKTQMKQELDKKKKKVVNKGQDKTRYLRQSDWICKIHELQLQMEQNAVVRMEVIHLQTVPGLRTSGLRATRT